LRCAIRRWLEQRSDPAIGRARHGCPAAVVCAQRRLTATVSRPARSETTLRRVFRRCFSRAAWTCAQEAPGGSHAGPVGLQSELAPVTLGGGAPLLSRPASLTRMGGSSRLRECSRGPLNSVAFLMDRSIARMGSWRMHRS
jgi:hypothetical protein